MINQTKILEVSCQDSPSRAQSAGGHAEALEHRKRGFLDQLDGVTSCLRDRPAA